VEFRGQFYNIPASKIGPKPIQKPHIPIYLGGYSQSTFVRVANYANGWICVIRHSLDEAKSNIYKIRNVVKQSEILKIFILQQYCIPML
jgi:alkanesulfonate monooxygenase SsuD/methylene tetrahydromethanopterin reductase-like flavin-dependent oxidoreductase (luciferase family)